MKSMATVEDEKEPLFYLLQETQATSVGLVQTWQLIYPDITPVRHEEELDYNKEWHAQQSRPAAFSQMFPADSHSAK